MNELAGNAYLDESSTHHNAAPLTDDMNALPAAIRGMRVERGDETYSQATQTAIRNFLQSAIDRDFFRRTFSLGQADSTPSFNQVCLEAEYLLQSLGEEVIPAAVLREQALEIRRLPATDGGVVCMMVLRPRTNNRGSATVSGRTRISYSRQWQRYSHRYAG